MLVVFSGCSGCGKNTIIKEVLKENKNYRLMPSVTTRAMRDGEKQGDPYYFVSEEEFKKRIDSGELMEWVEVHKGTLYGISNKIYQELSQKYDVLLKDVDVLGVQNARKAGVDVVAIFVKVDNKEELRNRLIDRKTTPEDIEKRLSRFELENSHINNMDYVIENNNLNDLPIAIEKINDIIKKELKKRQSGR